jgi:hypothetical protein
MGRIKNEVPIGFYPKDCQDQTYNSSNRLPAFHHDTAFATLRDRLTTGKDRPIVHPQILVLQHQVEIR